jgi:hypothetical protein
MYAKVREAGEEVKQAVRGRAPTGEREKAAVYDNSAV